MIDYRFDLQVLRGIAVIFVVLYHLKVQGFGNGYLGVDVFFVLSGFLMATLCESASPIEFYARRLRRLLPAYFVVVLVVVLLVALIAVPVDANQVFGRLWFDVVGLSNIAYWVENSYFDASAFRPLLNFWSLAVEIQFYLIAPFVLPFLRRRVLLAVLTLVVSVFAAMFIATVSPKTSFFWMPLRFWEFIVGAMVAWYPLGLSQGELRRILSGLTLLLLLCVIFFYPVMTDSLNVVNGHPGVAAALVSGLTALFISLSSSALVAFRGALGRFLSIIGDYSYSIYLIHFPVIVLLNYAPFGGTVLGAGGAFQVVLVVVATGLLSFLSYNYIETLRASARFNKFMGVAFVLVVAIGIVSPPINRSMYSVEQNIIFSAWTDRDRYRCGVVFRILNPTETVCAIGAERGGGRIMLLGNSHADSIKVSFAGAMDAVGFSTYFVTANNPLMSEKMASEAIGRDVRRLDVRGVAIHYSDDFYSDKFARGQLRNFVGAMRAAKVPVLFIAPVPVYKYHVPKRLYENTIGVGGVSKVALADEYRSWSSGFLDAVSDIGIDAGDVYYPHEYICESGECLLAVNGRPAYFDEGHLTLTGARVLMPLFLKMAHRIESVVRKSSATADPLPQALGHEKAMTAAVAR